MNIRKRIFSIVKFIDYIDDDGINAVFHDVFNVQVDEEKYHRQVNGNTIADTYCVKCGMLLGMKIIEVPYNNQIENIREGRFLMSASQLVYWNNKLMFVDEDDDDEAEGGANEHDHDQGGETDERDHHNDEDVNDQD